MARILAVLLFAAAALLVAAPAFCEVPTQREEQLRKFLNEYRQAYDGGLKERDREKERKEKEAREKKEKEQKEKEAKENSSEAKDLARAEEKLKAGSVNQAYSILAQLAKQEKDKDIAAKAAEKVKSIDQKAAEEVKAALVLEDPAAASKKIREVYGKYWQTSAKTAINDAIKQIAQRKAQKPADAAPAGKAAPDAPEAADGEKKQELDPDEAARMWLIVGDIHKINGRIDQAREAYEMVVEEYPQSRFLEEARTRIDRIRAARVSSVEEEKNER